MFSLLQERGIWREKAWQPDAFRKWMKRNEREILALRDQLLDPPLQ